MLRHPGGEEHSRHLIELAGLGPSSRWLDMGAGDGSAVRLLQNLGYDAEGIDLEPRGEAVVRGDYLECPWPDGAFTGILSQCSFYLSGDVPGALREAARLLPKGGRLVFSDVTEDRELLLHQCHQAGFFVRYREDLTALWREYYLEALWTQDDVCLMPGRKFHYILFVCEKVG